MKTEELLPGTGRLAGDLEVGGVAAHLVWRCGGWEAGGATVGRGPTTEIEGPEDRGLITGNPLEFRIMFTRIQNTDQWDRGPTIW